MAKLYNDFPSESLMSFGKSFSRLNGQPLDKSEVWFSFDEAQAYARTNAAYVGQKIAVVDTVLGTVTHYGIKNVAGDLEELGAATLGDNQSIVLEDKVLSLKNFGKKYYKYIPAEGDTPARYELTEGFIDGLEVKVHKTTSTTDAGDPYDTYELAYYQPNPTTVEGLTSQIASLNTQVSAAAGTASEAKSIAEERVSDVTGSGAVSASVNEITKVATVQIKLDNSGNVQFTQSDTGLKASVSIPAAPEYTINKLDTAEAGYASSYRLSKDGSLVGATINIPKDMVVSSGSVVENPEGQDPGTYVVLTLANATNDKLYINVGSLIEYVTSGSAAGDMVFVTVDETTHKVTATITDGTVTLAKLHADVQASLGKADSAVQSVTVLGLELSDGGALTVDQAKTALGLGSAAYKNESAFEPAGAASTAVSEAMSWKTIV